MPKVYNWQLGREMDYRFESGKQERQFAAVFNINRCIACQTCTMACKSTWTFSPGQELMWWNNVETKPYGGYPDHWDVQALELLERRPGRSGLERGASTRSGRPTASSRARHLRDRRWHSASRDRLHPCGRRVEVAEHLRGHGHAVPAGGVSLPEHSGWFFYLSASATTARIQPVSLPARATRPTSAKKTASYSSTKTGAGATASAWRRARTRSRCTGRARALRKSASDAIRALRARTR